MKTIIITGANGQLGQYLIKYLQNNEPDLVIIGTLRHKSSEHTDYIFDKDKVKFELMDLSDPHSIENLIIKYKPDYFVNTAANAFVGESWAVPVQQIDLNAIGVLHQLEAIRKHSPNTRYFNSGTSEEFAVSEKTGPQNEETKIWPKSPYGCAKACARYLVNVYRQSYGLYAIQGWTFNFESKLRGEKYVTRKITKGVARIYHAVKGNKTFKPLELGNIYSNRSWQHASDVAKGVWMMLNQEKYNKELYNYDCGTSSKISKLSKVIKEYVLSASDTYDVKTFIEKAFAQAGFYGYWKGEGINEQFIITDLDIDKNSNYKWSCGNEVVAAVSINKEFFRPLDVTFLYGDASRVEKELGWRPEVKFEDIVKEMVENDLQNT